MKERTIETIEHVPGSIDDYFVRIVNLVGHVFEFSVEDVFIMMDHFFVTEDKGGKTPRTWGSDMPWFLVTLIKLGYREEVMEIFDKPEEEHKEYFEELVREHSDDVIEYIEEMRDEKLPPEWDDEPANGAEPPW